MKTLRAAIVAVLSLGLMTPAHAATHGPVNPRPVCILTSCHDIVSFPTDAAISSNIREGLQNIELASDGKVWFAGLGLNGAAGTVGYIEPWNKDAGVHLCNPSLLTYGGFTVEPYNLVAGSNGTMDAVGFNDGVVHYDSDCTDASYPDTHPGGANRSAARDSNGHIWVAYTSSSSILDINSGTRLRNNWTVDIANGPDDNMWAIDDATNKVMTWDPNNAVSSYRTISLNFCTPQSIASDRNRFLWVTCGRTDVMVRIDTSAGHVGDLAYYNVPTGGGVGLPGATVTDDGVVWLTDQGDQAVKAFNAVTTGTGGENLNFVNFTKAEWSVATPDLRGITHDRDNNAWFINAADATINFIGMNAVGPKPTDPVEPPVPTEPSVPVEKTTKPTCGSPNQWTVYFANRSAKLSKAAKTTLDCVAVTVGKAKSIKIYGYTMTNKKSAVSKIANKKLAKKRAKAVRKYLRTKGVKAKIIVVAKGAVNPASTTNQAKNRRVVIVPKYQRMLKVL